jgi:hypothetical protein
VSGGLDPCLGVAYTARARETIMAAEIDTDGDEMPRSKSKQRRVRHKRIVAAKHRSERRKAAKAAEKAARR